MAAAAAGGGERVATTIAPLMINEKLRLFLSNAYLGPLYENGEPGERVGAYLYFLNPDDPNYKITTRGILRQLMGIYIQTNDIQSRSPGRGILGTRPDTDVRFYFADEYNTIIQQQIKEKASYAERGMKSPLHDIVGFDQVVMEYILSLNASHYESEDDAGFDREEYIRIVIALKEALVESNREMRNHKEEILENSHPLPDMSGTAGIKPAR